MATKGPGLQLLSDYTEDLVGFALESYLSVMSFPFSKFTIEPFSQHQERSIGADAKLVGRAKDFRPFYMQFKRPTAYPELSTSAIITDRKKHGLSTDPHALFFSLRDKQTGHVDYQHNVLYDLRQKVVSQGVGDACYVCPLFLDRATYRWHLHLSGLLRWLRFDRRVPWSPGSVVVNANGVTSSFSNIPMLAEHVSVPPHARVTSAKHKYSFAESGDDLAFHSEIKRLPDGSSTLGQFLDQVVGGDGAWIPPERSQEVLRAVVDGMRLPVEILSENGLESWLRFGGYLARTYGIAQYAAIRWNESERFTENKRR